ncbi:DUF6602 domain-containing protein [Solidesulfovibrio magneticus]|uniref:DUF6602 domain-containing protein n=1 Tax=Solidesulfovibrio magneticus (strain ATCC 700980 / DSM 13731 / RS-1) TaxID=573370 RepID=C4XNH7_SOLM1|nr:DUF6602 domain-containing protein [Solidesulfovibrio magneticus]BAH74952.1 hypothetical protein DMR_14610 [Solidesulfovibrio magneticus RS-1]
MSTWSLSTILAGLHDDIENRLRIARQSFNHPGTKGDASECVWLELLNSYLPQRYKAASAHVVDCNGQFSDQIDIVVFDRQYSPFIFNFQGQAIIPAESVYAVFEAKQSINAVQVGYAKEKAATVRKLHRTSLPIPHAGGTYPAKTPQHILAGLLTFESDWKPGLGKPLLDVLKTEDQNSVLDFGCVAAHGIYGSDVDGDFSFVPQGKPATAFLFELIARLQMIATVPMIDVRAYAKWLEAPSAP